MRFLKNETLTPSFHAMGSKKNYLWKNKLLQWNLARNEQKTHDIEEVWNMPIHAITIIGGGVFFSGKTCMWAIRNDYESHQYPGRSVDQLYNSAR